LISGILNKSRLDVSPQGSERAALRLGNPAMPVLYLTEQGSIVRKTSDGIDLSRIEGLRRAIASVEPVAQAAWELT
jgi:hypothetical protein